MGVWPSHPPAQVPGSFFAGAKKGKTADMDAIRKKMQSLKSETDGLYNTIAGFEEATREAAARADQADCDIRDYGKKVQQLEIGFDETNDKLTKATESLEEAEKQFKEVESDVSALTRRIMLMEEEDKKSAEQLCQTITTVKMASDNEQKLDELSRKLGVQEAELKRAVERAELAEKNLKDIEEELETVGENMKQLETSAEKALEREEKLVEKIYNLQSKYKVTEARFEYGEMNITKLNQRIDDIEDEIYREKLKIKKCSDELDDTFDDMIANY